MEVNEIPHNDNLNFCIIAKEHHNVSSNLGDTTSSKENTALLVPLITDKWLHVEHYIICLNTAIYSLLHHIQC